jgi:hypothetical protein
MNRHEIGNEVEAYCTKCKFDTIHIITAAEDGVISRVMCQTCNGYHKYKPAAAAQPIEPTIKIKKTKAPKEKKPVEIKEKKPKTTSRKMKTFELILEDSSKSDRIAYELAGNYSKGTVLEHRVFGTGVVKSVISDNKIQVQFREGTKILVQNYKND